MRLTELLKAVPEARPAASADPVVRGLKWDSRRVESGDLFVALPGQHVDGHTFIGEAVSRGACGVVVQGNVSIDDPGPGVAVVQVPDTRSAMARFAERFYDYPSSRLRLIGVTGTNGKTTTTYLIRSILKAAGQSAGVIGTIGYDLNGERLEASHTTPESIELQNLLARLVERKTDFGVMEVSSHALAQSRAEGCEFDAAVFTNLTQDHLDFHPTMEDYFQAKRQLFFEARPRKKNRALRAIINGDDPWGKRLAFEVPGPVWTYGMETKTDFSAGHLDSDLSGLRFSIQTPSGEIPIQSSLIGRHNVYNILAAVAAALHFDISFEDIARGVEALSGVPGRFERIPSDLGFTVVVDYAHTEAALDRLLKTVRGLTTGRVITVFGCGGDRDPGKRNPMGRVSARYSDRVVITSDNPRTEDPRDIITPIETGVRDESALLDRRVDWEIVTDRREAICHALFGAREDDCVVVAGKGHEDYQILGKKKIPFDDRTVIRDWVRKASGRRNP